MALSAKEVEAATFEPTDDTKGFRMQQTMIRVKDPRASLKFYTQVLGMRLLKRLDCPNLKFTLYFMGYAHKSEVPQDEEKRTEFCFNQLATVELTHNWGTEEQEGNVYHNGNTDPRGFGHLGIFVPDVYAACERFEKLGVAFQKKPDQGTMSEVAFVKDPDGYWIEILSLSSVRKHEKSGILTVLS